MLENLRFLHTQAPALLIFATVFRGRKFRKTGLTMVAPEKMLHRFLLSGEKNRLQFSFPVIKPGELGHSSETCLVAFGAGHGIEVPVVRFLEQSFRSFSVMDIYH